MSSMTFSFLWRKPLYNKLNSAYEPVLRLNNQELVYILKNDLQFFFCSSLFAFMYLSPDVCLNHKCLADKKTSKLLNSTYCAEVNLIIGSCHYVIILQHGAILYYIAEISVFVIATMD